MSSGHPRNTPGGRFNFASAQLRRIVRELALPLLQDFPDIVGDAHRYVCSSKYLPRLICIQDNFARNEIGGVTAVLVRRELLLVFGKKIADDLAVFFAHMWNVGANLAFKPLVVDVMDYPFQPLERPC